MFAHLCTVGHDSLQSLPNSISPKTKNTKNTPIDSDHSLKNELQDDFEFEIEVGKQT